MYNAISFCIIQQLLFFTSSVEPLRGKNVVSASNREFPFIASLQTNRGRHFCTGSLITNRHVLTAAHCLEDQHPDRVLIVLGVNDLRNAVIGNRVTPWYTYRDWARNLGITGAADFHDVAIVPLLEEIINWNLNVQPNVIPVRLSQLNKQQVQGKSATILGWTDNMGLKVLKKAVVHVLKDDDCARRVRFITYKEKYHYFTSPKILCTAAEPYVLLQGGDSGSPLLDQYGRLLSVHYGDGPQRIYSWANVTEKFLQPYQFRGGGYLWRRKGARAILEIMRHDIDETFAMAGCSSVQEFTQDFVTHEILHAHL